MARHLAILFAATAAIVFPQAAAAQSAPVHVALGYQVVHIPDETYPLGIGASVYGREAGLTWAGEVGWSRDDQNEPGVSGSLTLIDYGVGPRWTATGSRVRPFAQLLAGGAHTSASLTLNGAPFEAGSNAFMLQPGAGVTIPMASRWGVFGQADYRRVFWSGEAENEYRVMFGVRVASSR